MSVKVGSAGMKSLYLGSQKIVKAYVGQELVHSENKPSRLRIFNWGRIIPL